MTTAETTPLLSYLFKNFPQFKKTKVKQILKHGSVTVNGEVVTRHDHPVKPKDVVQILSKMEATRVRIKKALPFPILYEDDALIVIDKPAGLLSMGTDKEKEETAYFEVTAYVRSLTPDEKGRVYIVHRLDKDASGVMVFAKKEAVKDTLQENWTSTIKKYHAVVEGVPDPRSGQIESHLIEDSFRRVFSSQSRTRDSKHALTHYRVLKNNGRYALMDLSLATGRKNQLRVHMHDIGHPIVGDEKYGSHGSPLQRLALHAYFLSFPHPTTQERMVFEAPMPNSFKKIITAAYRDK